jgi:3-isopropylmalate/(R)-2-methylmalate dehydratase large subunit
MWQQAQTAWQDLHSDPQAQFDKTITIDASTIKPQVTWGTSPELVVAVNDKVPDPAMVNDPVKAKVCSKL